MGRDVKDRGQRRNRCCIRRNQEEGAIKRLIPSSSWDLFPPHVLHACTPFPESPFQARNEHQAVFLFPFASEKNKTCAEEE
jgi:hypothetical protein